MERYSEFLHSNKIHTDHCCQMKAKIDCMLLLTILHIYFQSAKYDISNSEQYFFKAKARNNKYQFLVSELYPLLSAVNVLQNSAI